jgi:hypothetical protein
MGTNILFGTVPVRFPEGKMGEHSCIPLGYILDTGRIGMGWNGVRSCTGVPARPPLAPQGT